MPFTAILAIGGVLVVLYPLYSRLALALLQPGRMLAATRMLFPLGFILEMPFPLGIRAISNQLTGATAWAWGMNGLFTVVGGLLSVVLGVLLGFNFTILLALAIYVLAFAVFPRLRAMAPQTHGREVAAAGAHPTTA